MRVKFWGTRGSIAKPGAGTARYGGNTSCVEVRSDSGTLIVLDCGTGGHALGQQLCADAKGPVSGHLFISHTHWDHIQGIPFFAPLFVPGGHWDIYGPKGLSSSLRTTLAGQMEHTYFPISIDQLEARIDYHDLVEGAIQIGDIKITTHFLNHPALTLGYRLEADGASVVYSCDHEPHSTALADGESEITGPDRRHAEFVAGADLVIHDAQYTAKEYPDKVGWGHSPVEYAVRVCRDAGVKRLALTHHDPMRDDAAVDRIIENIRDELRRSESSLDVIAAAEGQSIDLSGTSLAPDYREASGFRADATIDVMPDERAVVLYADDPALAQSIRDAVIAEGFHCNVAKDPEDLLRRIKLDEPALALIAHDPPGHDGIELVRAIRAAGSADQTQIPAVLVASRELADQAEQEIATDWLVTPFTESYARTKIRAWVLRTSCRWIRARYPDSEQRRIRALDSLQILDTPSEERFDRVTRIAAAAFDVPIVLVSLVDRDRQWFKSCFGVDVAETPRDVAFCAHVVHDLEELIVPDTLLDDRFADNPLVIDPPRIRFYAGAPLTLEDGNCIGTLCLIDVRPRNLDDGDLTLLRDLRDLVLSEIQD